MLRTLLSTLLLVVLIWAFWALCSTSVFLSTVTILLVSLTCVCWANCSTQKSPQNLLHHSFTELSAQSCKRKDCKSEDPKHSGDFRQFEAIPSGGFLRLDQSSQERSPQSVPSEVTQPPSQGGPQTDFHIFVQRLVHLFQHQRTGNEQFAVLLLASSPGYTSIVFRTAHCEVRTPDKATDKTCTSFPPDADLCNYITARSSGPDGPQHAEVELMNRFNELWRRYNATLPAYKYMVLYTWSLPCAYCADKIVNKLREFRKLNDLKLLLVYTKCEVTQQQKDGITENLEEHNIAVIQEDYDPKAASNHALVQTLIQSFKHQRQERFQFAVIFLASPRHEAKIKFRIRESGVIRITTERVTDNSLPIFPPDDQICNYLTARPDGNEADKHAEALLMQKFSMLEDKYKESNLPPHKCIVLYTWLLPCPSCAQKIIDTLKGNPVKVFLFYTSKMRSVTPEEEQQIVRKLQHHGIKVTCETSDEELGRL